MSKKTKKILKITLLIIVIIFAIGLTIVNIILLHQNKKITEKFQSYTNKPQYYLDVQDPNKLPTLIIKNFKKLNFESEIAEKEFDSTETIMSQKKLEEQLGINLLNSPDQKNQDIAILQLEKVNNKVGSGLFYIHDAFNIPSKNKKKPKITITIEFITKYTKTYTNGISFYLGANSDEMINTRYINNLNTFVYFGFAKKDLKDNEIVSQLMAYFVHDDIIYTFEGNNISRNMLIEILESLQ